MMKKRYVLWLCMVFMAFIVSCNGKTLPSDRIVDENKTKGSMDSTNHSSLVSKKENPYQFMMDGKLYVDTGETEESVKCGVMDKKLSFKNLIPRNLIPSKDGEANFKSKFGGAQYGLRDNRMVAYVDDKWHIFAYNENNLDGVSMKVTDATSTNARVSFHNQLRKEFIFGTWFLIENYNPETGTWIPIPEYCEYVAFEDIAYILKAAAETEHVVEFEWRYGELEPGTYRLVKDVIDSTLSDGYDKYWLTAEFVVE